MPNYVRNVVYIEGPEDDILDFCNTVRTDNRDFDFDAIVPMPGELQVTIPIATENHANSIVSMVSKQVDSKIASGLLPRDIDLKDVRKEALVVLDSLSDDDLFDICTPQGLALEQREDARAKWLEIAPISSLIDVDLPPARYVDIARQAASRIIRLGHTSWYDWSIDHWGTKWNACHVEWQDGDPPIFVRLDTAWSTPEGIWKAIAIRWPTLHFSVDYADEDYGSNCGFVTIENGEVTFALPDGDPLDHALEVWNGWVDNARIRYVAQEVEYSLGWRVKHPDKYPEDNRELVHNVIAADYTFYVPDGMTKEAFADEVYAFMEQQGLFDLTV